MSVLAFIAVVATTGVTAAAGPAADEIPYFARKYNVTCAQCHVSPPKLNEFGQAFLARGYALPGTESERTWPFAIWLSGRSESLSSAEVDGLISYVNRLEVVSGGEVIAPWLSYFVEWRPWSQESRPDGSLRDRSGRFEDLFLIVGGERLEVMVGQFRQVQQVDVSQRISLSEPLVLSAGVPGGGEGTARQRALRSFAPAARSPSVRVAWNSALGQWGWTSAVAVPLPGEFSIPLTREARTEASNELEWDPKGVFLESYVRRGLTTVGGHAFYDPSLQRFLVNAVTTGHRGPFHWTIMGGAERGGSGSPLRGRWSVEGEYFPSGFAGAGVRVEDRAGDGLSRAILPYLNFHFPGTTFTARLTVEQRIQSGRNATLVELGTIF